MALEVSDTPEKALTPCWRLRTLKARLDAFQCVAKVSHRNVTRMIDGASQAAAVVAVIRAQFVNLPARFAVAVSTSKGVLPFSFRRAEASQESTTMPCEVGLTIRLIPAASKSPHLIGMGLAPRALMLTHSLGMASPMPSISHCGEASWRAVDGAPLPASDGASAVITHPVHAPNSTEQFRQRHEDGASESSRPERTIGA